MRIAGVDTVHVGLRRRVGRHAAGRRHLLLLRRQRGVGLGARRDRDQQAPAGLPMTTPAATLPDTANDTGLVEVPIVLPTPQRLHILAYCGGLLLLFNLAAPYAGLIGIPISFLLKNKLHLGASQLAQFNLWIGIPLYVSFVFGFVRDRWSPFGAGDRGHLILFGLTTAAIYTACAFVSPTYA